MSENRKVHLDDITAYVNASVDLAEQIKSDLKNNHGIITHETVLALNDFIISAKSLEYLTDTLQADRVRLTKKPSNSAHNNVKETYMAYKTVSALDADTTISLGGMNKKTGKKNPTQVEGYYVGKKEVDSPKAKSGKAFLYILQTESGNVGVWGKTDLDRKMQQAVAGRMTLIKQSGTKPTKNGDMYTYTLAQDEDNTIEVSTPAAQVEVTEDEGPSYSGNASGYQDEDDEIDGGNDEAEERTQQLALSALERKAKLDALLKKPTAKK